MPEWLKTWAPAVPWLLVIIGWKVVSHDQNKRERRKEIWQVVCRVTKLIRDVEDAAIGYWNSNAGDANEKKSAAELKRRLQHIGLDLARISAECDKLGSSLLMVAFRQSVTDSDFESVNRVADAERGGRISRSAENLIDAIEAGFRTQFVDKWTNFLS